MRIRWSDNDRYFGPFTYARSTTYRPFSVMLGSGDNDDYPGCRLRLSAFGHTLILALPTIIKPWKVWHEIRTEPNRSEMIAAGRKPGYFDQYEREYGFSLVEGAAHWHYGPQTHDSTTTKSSCWFYPWREHRQVRHSIYDLNGELFADLPQGRHGLNRYAASEALKAACPAAKFFFLDYDGEQITATCRIEEREYKRGKGFFRILFLGRNSVYRDLDLSFSAEVGRRKGSWKGGTVGHSIKSPAGELHADAFRRYCSENNLQFVGPALEVAA